MNLAPTIHENKRRNGKPMIVARCPSDGSGYKTRAARLAEALHGRWSHRQGGYVMSRRGADRLVAYYRDGWDASYISATLQPPPTPYEQRVRALEAEGMTTSDAQAIADIEGHSDRR